ncbi:DUF3828 domain-containing protein [Chryseobacterium terrae]|uniref:DUF3828 domain-containing protein n=1 Tax=Chryseobacterium terrae TaxID=3163299 RepID=A0ABW8Y2P3_9FLAO
MKKYFLSLLLIIIFSCKKKSQTFVDSKDKITVTDHRDSEKKAIHIIKDFYFSEYGSDMPPKDESIKKKYLSDRILNRIRELTSDGENLVLDYDPFIKGQDYDSETLKKTLEIKPLNKKNEYRVSFLLFGEKGEGKTNIDLLLSESNGVLKIDAILNDEHLNFQNDNTIKQVNESENIKLKVINSDLKISKGNSEILLKDVIKNEMSLSTSFKTINENEFYLTYENNASQVKTVEIYTMSFSGKKIKLLSKETVKFGAQGIDDNLFLYDEKYLGSNDNYEKLSSLDYRESGNFSKNPVKKNVYKNSQKIDTKEYNVLPEEYFINKTSNSN